MEQLNIFQRVKQSVTTRQAASFYGLKVGRNGMCLCPFHDDRNPSMKVDTRFHCFACNADGDVIDFVSRLFDCSLYEAATKLAADFNIRFINPNCLTRNLRRLQSDTKQPVTSTSRFSPDRAHQASTKQLPPKQKSIDLFTGQAQHTFRIYCDYLHLLDEWREQYSPRAPNESYHPLFVEALQNRSVISYLLDCMLDSTDEELSDIITEKAKEALILEERINHYRRRFDGASPSK